MPSFFIFRAEPMVLVPASEAKKIGKGCANEETGTNTKGGQQLMPRASRPFLCPEKLAKLDSANCKGGKLFKYKTLNTISSCASQCRVCSLCVTGAGLIVAQ